METRRFGTALRFVFNLDFAVREKLRLQPFKSNFPCRETNGRFLCKSQPMAEETQGAEPERNTANNFFFPPFEFLCMWMKALAELGKYCACKRRAEVFSHVWEGVNEGREKRKLFRLSDEKQQVNCGVEEDLEIFG